MKMIIRYDGYVYETCDNNEATAREAADNFYSLGDLNKLQVGLKDGGFLFLGKEAVSKCAIMFVD